MKGFVIYTWDEFINLSPEEKDRIISEPDEPDEED